MSRHQIDTNLSVFDIKDGNWTEYIEHMQSYFANKCIVKEHEATILLNNIGENAYKLLYVLSADSKPLTSMTFEEIVNVMKDYLKSKSSVVFHRYKFRQRMQNADESLEDYYKCLKTLVIPCQYLNSSEEIRDQFIGGIQNDIIRLILLSKGATDYSNSVELVKSIDRLLKQCESKSGSGEPSASIRTRDEQLNYSENSIALSPNLSQTRHKVKNYCRVLSKIRLSNRRRHVDSRNISKCRWSRFTGSCDSESNADKAESNGDSPRFVYTGGQWIARGVERLDSVGRPFRFALCDQSSSTSSSDCGDTTESDESAAADVMKHAGRFKSLPDKVRTQPERQSPDDTLYAILSSMSKPPPEIQSPITFKNTVLGKHPEYLDNIDNLKQFKSVYDWHFTFLSSGKNSPDLRFFIGCGGKQVYQLEGIKWRNVVDLQVAMPAKTLIYGEVVKEYRGEGSTQMYSKALHVIDALMLGGIDISNLPLTERLNQCSLFCTALDKPFNSNILPIRCKRFFNLESFSTAINNLEYRAMKRIKRAVTFSITNRISQQEVFHVIGSLLFIKEIKEPWESRLSKSSGHKYYFGIGKDNKPRSEYYIPEAARLDMISAFRSRVQWPWEPASAVLEGTPHSGLTKCQLEDYITSNINR